MSTNPPAAALIRGVDFLTIATSDFPAAVEFYETTLGLPLTARYGTRDGAEFETGNLTLSVVHESLMGGSRTVRNQPIAFAVDDVAAARAELESRGVVFGADTMDTSVCHMAFFTDPDGHALMLHKRYAPRTPSGLRPGSARA